LGEKGGGESEQRPDSKTMMAVQGVSVAMHSGSMSALITVIGYHQDRVGSLGLNGVFLFLAIMSLGSFNICSSLSRH